MPASVENSVALQQALEYAMQCHAGMFDRTGSPFVLHVLRVGMKQTTYDGQIVGFLHDTIEKGNATKQGIAERFGEDIAEAVHLLTHVKPLPYMEYIAALAGNLLASMVKLADIEDNSDVRRMDARAAEKFPLYVEAHEYLCREWSINRKLTIAPN